MYWSYDIASSQKIKTPKKITAVNFLEICQKKEMEIYRQAGRQTDRQTYDREKNKYQFN